MYAIGFDNIRHILVEATKSSGLGRRLKPDNQSRKLAELNFTSPPRPMASSSAPIRFYCTSGSINT